MAQNYTDAIKEMLKGIKYIIDNAMSHTMTGYDGIIVSQSASANGKWDVQFNGEVHAIRPYGAIVPKRGAVVKVLIPSNNMSLAYFI